MTSRELIRWERTYAKRARRGWWTARIVIALVAGGALAAFVWWRGTSTPIAASHAWLAAVIAAFAFAFMRVPFHLYWRSDAALLAQLPIEGGALLDAALLRCVLAAATTTAVAIIGAIPLALLDEQAVNWATRTLKAMPFAGDEVPRLTPLEFFAHHAAYAGALGVTAACLMPAVATWAATLVARGSVLQTAVALGGAPVRNAAPQPPGSAGAILGALPGFASAIVFVVMLLASPWLHDEESAAPALPVLGGLVVASIAALAAVRASASRVMGAVLRDVSALDRQRLATLEIHPPTALERGVASLLGDAGLPYRKDARLMRRRYPMAFALGALAFIVLAIIGLARPTDPTPWLVATLVGTALYGAALANRLPRPPIELPRLSATLPISAPARTRAKVAWIVTWALVFVAVPATFALVRTLA